MEKLRNILEEIEEAFESAKTKEKQIHEYGHYTSINALESIANTSHSHDDLLFIKLWFTEAYCTNDKQEASYGYDFMMNSFSAIESYLKIKEDRFLITNYEDELKWSNKFKNKTSEQIREWLTHQEATPFIMSLTRKKDNLDMWLKTYGYGGKGVCLIFDFTNIDNYRYQSDFFIHGPFSVVYGNRLGYLEEKNMLQEIAWKEYYRFINDVCQLNDFDAILERKILAMDQVCSLISSFIKGEEWYNESEERMVALRHFISCKDNPKTIVQNNNKKHIEVVVPASCLKKIIIGSCSDSDSIKIVRDAAEKIGIQYNNVIKSDCPLQ